MWNCTHLSTSVCGPQYSFVIKKSFSCQTSGLVYCISCRRCPAVYIGETGRTLRQRFGEHLRSIEKNLPAFPVAEHFNTAAHSIDDALVRGMMLSVDNAQRKRLEMRLIFQLGTTQPRGLNFNFRFLSAARRAVRALQSLKFSFLIYGEYKPWITERLINWEIYAKDHLT